MVDRIDFKDALGQGAGFVKDHISGLGQGFQIVGSLYQDAFPAGAADSRKKA